jgi:hypothetical protein
MSEKVDKEELMKRNMTHLQPERERITFMVILKIGGGFNLYGSEGPASSSAYEPDEDHEELEVCTRCGKAYPEPHTDGCPRKQEEEEAIRRRWIIRKEEKEDRNKEEKIQEKLKKYDEYSQIAKEQERSGQTRQEFEAKTRSQNECDLCGRAMAPATDSWGFIKRSCEECELQQSECRQCGAKRKRRPQGHRQLVLSVCGMHTPTGRGRKEGPQKTVGASQSKEAGRILRK